MNDSAVFISVIMPVYNAERYLFEALKQIEKQSFSNYELILVDGCSNDLSPRIAEAAIIQNKRIRWFSQPDKGIYDAMNFGITQSIGKWIYFMGCDDSFYNHNVLNEISLSLSDEYDIVYGDVLWIPEHEAEAGLCTPQTLFNRNINHQRIFYRRTLFHQFGMFNVIYKIASDYELNIRFFCNDNIRKKYIPLMVANYHSGGFSAHKQDELFWCNWKRNFRDHFLKHIPRRNMYSKLGWYCRYLIERRQFKKAFPLFCDVLLHTFSPGFVWLTTRHFLRTLNQDAG